MLSKSAKSNLQTAKQGTSQLTKRISREKDYIQLNGCQSNSLAMTATTAIIAPAFQSRVGFLNHGH